MKIVKPEEFSTVEDGDLTEVLEELARKYLERVQELTHDK